jgi:hypothetical protein
VCHDRHGSALAGYLRLEAWTLLDSLHSFVQTRRPVLRLPSADLLDLRMGLIDALLAAGHCRVG